MPALNSVCVYCGSSFGSDPAFGDAASAVGRLLADNNITLVYGGGAVGLMGVVADAALEAGGRVVGVLPSGLFSREVGHTGLTELIEVDSLLARKQTMFDRSDAFVALPGGIGTFDELIEMITWAQLGIHDKPIATFDVGGYWEPFRALVQHSVDHGFTRRRVSVINVDTIDALLPALRGPRP